MVEVIESAWGDWWVIVDDRLVAVHLKDREMEALDAATRDVSAHDPDHGPAVHGFGTDPRAFLPPYVGGRRAPGLKKWAERYTYG